MGWQDELKEEGASKWIVSKNGDTKTRELLFILITKFF